MSERVLLRKRVLTMSMSTDVEMDSKMVQKSVMESDKLSVEMERHVDQVVPVLSMGYVVLRVDLPIIVLQEVMD